MSVRVTSLVWRLPLTPAQKVLAVYLADSANDDGSNYLPALDRLAAECGLSAKSVRRGLSQLQADGLLTIKAGAGGELTGPSSFTFDLARIDARISRGKRGGAAGETR